MNLIFLTLILTVNSKCFEHPKPTSKGFMQQVDCGFNDDEISAGGQLGQTPLKSKLKSNGTTPNSDKTNSTNSGITNMIQTTLSCQVDQNTCNLVSNTFNTAGIYLSNVIQFNSPVTVQASFYSFCKVSGDCSKSQVTLGQAAAARSVALKDDDGQERLYPQALVKQIKLNPMPKISSYDIVAEFNSDANFWFPGSGGSPSRSQVDFLLVVSHELLHGLGFASSYNDYFSNDQPVALTPNPELGRTSSGQLALTGFYENVFDRYVQLLDTKESLSNYSRQFNNFASTQKVYQSTNELISSFQSSSQYDLGKKLLTMSSRAGSMGFDINKSTTTCQNGTLILETSLSPFSVGSSISHVAYSTYSNTEEFLMRYEMAPGASLSSLVTKLGSWGSEPYGPSVVAVLERMGYPTNENPDPNILASYPAGASSIKVLFSPTILFLLWLTLLQ